MARRIEKHLKQDPGRFFLDLDQPRALREYLIHKGLLDGEEQVTLLEKPGEGNMNCVARAGTGKRSFIIKQSRPWVEKYPQIDAPENRASIEGQFYELVSSDSTIRKALPDLIFKDPHSNILVLEDVGESADYSFLYNTAATLQKEEITMLIGFLTRLHLTFTRESTDGYITNKEMRQLNHEHIFIFPLMPDNGLNLDAINEGLDEVAKTYHGDSALREKAEKLGKLYLRDGDHLLHGDFYPGSWLKTSSGIRIIDPEFCFFGPGEFDLAIFTAHLIMAGEDQGNVRIALEQYRCESTLDPEIFFNFVGIEIIRRIIGVAQLPLSLDLVQKAQLLKESRFLLLDPDRSVFLKLLK